MTDPRNDNGGPAIWMALGAGFVLAVAIPAALAAGVPIETIVDVAVVIAVVPVLVVAAAIFGRFHGWIDNVCGTNEGPGTDAGSLGGDPPTRKDDR